MNNKGHLQQVRLARGEHRPGRLRAAEMEGIRTSTCNGEKLYHCPYCSYTTNKNIKRHIRMHNGEKPFACPYCHFRASQKTHLDAHIRRHTGERPYTCPICGVGFALRGSLKTHLMKHSGEKSHSCEVCSYCSSGKRDLKSMLRLTTLTEVEEYSTLSILFPKNCSYNYLKPVQI